MEQVSNKTLTFLLIVAIVISIGGTIISINRINKVVLGATGMGSTGMVNVTIAQTASVNAIDAQIIFGSCPPPGTYGCNVSSNSSSAECSCTGGTWPDNITVQNDGNVNLNVTVKTNVLASTMIGGTNPNFWFMARNASTRPGCFNGTTNFALQQDWFNFTAVNTEFTACGNLTWGNTNDQIEVFAKLLLPQDAPIATGKNATLTFTANAMP